MNNISVKRVFAAVFDKSVLGMFLDALNKNSVRFWGTEGTIKYIKSQGFGGESVVGEFDYDGRVKSLDRANFVRILADTTKNNHLNHLKVEKLEPIDAVVVDLYAPDPKIFPESMDIGGVSLIRAAVKNYKNVAVAYDKKSIWDLAKEIKLNRGATTLAFRTKQAKMATNFIAQRVALEAKMFEKIY